MSGISKITSTGIYTGDNLLLHNTGTYNTFVGENAGNTTMTGNGYNTVVGVSSMYNNLSGKRNSTVGYASLINNTTGDYNSAFGGQSLNSNKTGNSNTALGYNACKNAYLDPTYGVYIGSEISSSVTGISDTSRASVYNEIVIGANAVGNSSNTITLGNTDITDTYIRGLIHSNKTASTYYTQSDSSDYLVPVVASSFGSSSGYIKYANGLMMQWVQKPVTLQENLNVGNFAEETLSFPSTLSTVLFCTVEITGNYYPYITLHAWEWSTTISQTIAYSTSLIITGTKRSATFIGLRIGIA